MSTAVRARRTTKRKRRGVSLALSIVQLCVLVAIAIGAVFFALAFWNVSTILPTIGDVTSMAASESTQIYADTGELLAVVYEDQNREYVPLSQMPKHLIDATVAIEDKRFFEHNGVDFRGIGRALLEDIRNQRRSQGGSTITQQLARDVYLTKKKTLSRKLQEAILAVQIERKYSKPEILEMYLNRVFYGSGAYGVQAAARVYFNKNVSQLNLPECAMLAALPRRPSSYSPYHDIELAKERRDIVLDEMAESGKITKAEAEAAKASPIKLAFKRPSSARIRRAPYFVDYVLRELVDRYGDQNVYRGGLRVYTTLHTGIQAAADRAIREGIRRNAYAHVSQGALVCMDPVSGYIRAMVGGVDYEKSQLNRAYLIGHPRQPGSSFKPFVYAAALESGMTPQTRILDAPISYPGGPGGRMWTPHNYGGGYSGWVTMTRAIARSINIPAIRTLDKIGIDKAIEMAHRLGVVSPISHNLSIAIGTSGVTVLEMAHAYCAFANGGLLPDPVCITRVTDREGGVIEEIHPRAHRVLSPDVAHAMDAMLREVVTSGTASRGAGRIPEARGKTGTTQSERDAWFIGYTPKLLAAVWVGNDDNSPMRHATGGVICAPIWADFMEEALKMQARTPKVEVVDRKPGQSAPEEDARSARRARERLSDENGTPSGDSPAEDLVSVPICDDSGMVATSACPSSHMEQFERGTEPKERCTIHGGESRGPATEPGVSGPAAPPAGSSSTPPGAPFGQGRPRPPDVDVPPEPAQPEPVHWVRVRLCVQSGLLATDYCPETIQRRMRSDEAPTTYCPIHRSRAR